MTNLVSYDPFAETGLDELFRGFFAPVRFEGAPRTPITIKMDVTETDDGYMIHAEMPGVKKEDINVRIDGNVVQIDAEVKRESETKGNGGKVLRSERYHGTISRSFSLAEDVDETKAEAKYVDGVLTLTLPKKATAAARKVTVQ